MSGTHVVENRSLAALDGFVPAERLESTASDLERLRSCLNGRRVVNITGDDRHKGGVYEILRNALPYIAGAGIDVSWFDIETAVEAREALEFAHVLGHGVVPANGENIAGQAELLGTFGALGADALVPRLRPTDVVVMHDTQTALLVPAVRRVVSHVVWHAHIGTHDHVASAPYWSIFASPLTEASRCIFYLSEFVPQQLSPISVAIRPGVDPSSTKNAPVTPDLARGALRRLPSHLVTEHAGSFQTLGTTAFVACQVSRWDPLKDMAGVVEAFGRVATNDANFHGIVIGTLAQSASEREQLRQALAIHSNLAGSARQRVHIATVGASGTEAHDRAVGVFQAVADVAVQKSLREGFGLTVTESMLRGKAVVASRVGGIQYQINHGITGLLLDEPTDTEACVSLIHSLAAATRRALIGERAARAAFELGTIDRYVREVANCLAEVIDM